MGIIYKHPSMPVNDFNDNYLSPVLHKLSTGNKSVIILGDFNVDLLKCDTDLNTSEYFNLLSSNNFLPYITLPTRITAQSSTLIDNIFSNCINQKIISGNLTSTVSDHLPQFFIYPGMNKKLFPVNTMYTKEILIIITKINCIQIF